MRSMVITFDQHPRQVVHADYVPQLITPTEEKLRLLRLTEANDVEVLHFDANMAAMSAREVMQNVQHIPTWREVSAHRLRQPFRT